MRFSAKAEYGIWALLELALNEGRGPLQVRAISKRHHIPLRFLEQVMSVLKNSGFVESIRGAQGGYILARSPKEITLGQIVQSIEGTLSPMICITEGDDQQCLQPVEPPHCVLKGVWKEVRSAILSVLDRLTLQELSERYRAVEQKTNMMFHI
ncbi:MAG: Rrf2 family transcriptional regulator [Nitrospirae bacterium]|nr:Rrf2 family transcriptional regulator [Nitrospirota bacterium]MBI3352692.1 Rrf2 family transcriptional regulator [Nitrospirota bacterium]